MPFLSELQTGLPQECYNSGVPTTLLIVMVASVLRHSTLLGRLMLDYDTTDELGMVDGLLVNIAQATVVGIVIQGPLWQRQRPIYGWSQVTNVGDSLVLQRRSGEPPSAAAQPMVGLEVWTDTGNCLGKIVDYRFERQGAISQYLFAQPERPGLYGLPPEAIISAGRKRIMVSEQSAARAEHFADETVPMDQQDWQTTAQSTAQSFVGQVQQRAQGLSDYAQERWLAEEQLQSTSQQFQERTQGLRSQLNQQVSKAKKRLGPLNKALENRLENTLDKFNQSSETPSIDLDSFEVWEEDEQ
ncbi:MAG: hypothetical protein AAF821_11185 [Cyanobacteria bacterium P01_D01_bin.156]